MSQERAMDVTPYVATAQQIVRELCARVPLTSAILDDWNADARMVGPRIIYGARFVRDCRSDCTHCPLFCAIGDHEQPSNTPVLRRTLCQARPDQLALFPSKQRYLNCKTIREYEGVFVRWIVDRCPDERSLIAELDWVAGFRLLYARSFDTKLLATREREIKRRIYLAALKELREHNDRTREEIARTYYRTWCRTKVACGA